MPLMAGAGKLPLEPILRLTTDRRYGVPHGIHTLKNSLMAKFGNGKRTSGLCWVTFVVQDRTSDVDGHAQKGDI